MPKLGWVTIQSNRPLLGQVREVSITKDIDKWYVSIVALIEEPLPIHEHPSTAVGLDMGVAKAVVDSNGAMLENQMFLAKSAKRLAKAQRDLARKVKGSENRKKAVEKVAKIYRKIRQQRNNFAHQVSHHYSKHFESVIVEDLKVSNMTRSAKGDIKNPGKNVAQKSGLNRNILDVGWGKIREQLKYKCDREGGKLIAINPRYTSQTCSECGCIDKESRLSQSEFVCVACGHSENADVNAAKNILRTGLEPVPEVPTDRRCKPVERSTRPRRSRKAQEQLCL
jgi:putative transposase